MCVEVCGVLAGGCWWLLYACGRDYSVWAVSLLLRANQRSRVGASRSCRPHSVAFGVRSSALSWGRGRGSEAKQLTKQKGLDRGRTGKRAQLARRTEQRYDELAGGQVGGGGVEGFTSAVAARSISGASGDMSWAVEEIGWLPRCGHHCRRCMHGQERAVTRA